MHTKIILFAATNESVSILLPAIKRLILNRAPYKEGPWMLTLWLILIPTLGGAAAFGLKPDILRRLLLIGVGVAHLGLTVCTWFHPTEPLLGGWIHLDPLGRLFLTVTSILFAASSIYLWGYLREQGATTQVDLELGAFQNNSEAIFTGCLLWFLSSMTLVTMSQHFGLLWVMVEATTLSSAPLIYFHRQHRSLEAAWKYLLICSVGIALALMGNFLMAKAASTAENGHVSLVVSDLVQHAKDLDLVWLKAAFLFFLVGYGTKIGLAPLHTWLPDAHSESPSAVSALFSGALINCAFLALLRVVQVCHAAGLQEVTSQLLIGFGLLSMAFGAAFIFAQRDYKRLLAYSSVENMGIQAFGVGLGGVATSGALLHVLASGLTKGLMFLVAGNIMHTYQTKSTRDVAGLWRKMPWSGALWTFGFLSLTGAPPFAPFLSEFTILKGALETNHAVAGGLYLLLLAVVFIGMSAIVLKMSQGDPHPHCNPENVHGDWSSIGPPLVLCALVAGLGLCIPPQLSDACREAAISLGGSGW
ncbi:MAG: NADH/Ubiquinone/plastoquinone [Planctomycetaceae bacterium]|nr:NADH/Ubiquinone/plastoquinone [Planctomycetaceae bacterium]